MRTGTITINKSGVFINPIKGTVWMTRHEISDLFGTVISTVDANLRAIFKSEMIREPDVFHTHRYVGKNGTECQTIVCNLDVIMA